MSALVQRSKFDTTNQRPQTDQVAIHSLKLKRLWVNVLTITDRFIKRLLEFLPDTPYIYQGDWIGFGGEREYTPNTLTYLFPDHTGEDIIIAPHTRYELCGDNGLQDVYGLPINQDELKSTAACRFVRPRCRMYSGYYNHLEGKDDRFESVSYTHLTLPTTPYV